MIGGQTAEASLWLIVLTSVAAITFCLSSCTSLLGVQRSEDEDFKGSYTSSKIFFCIGMCLATNIVAWFAWDSLSKVNQKEIEFAI